MLGSEASVGLIQIMFEPEEWSVLLLLGTRWDEVCKAMAAWAAFKKIMAIF